MTRITASMIIGGLTAFSGMFATYGNMLTWTGRHSGNWNATEYNWVDEDGNEAVFKNGSDVMFDDSAERTTVFVAASMTAGRVIVSNTATAYLITNTATGNSVTKIAEFRKRGSGKLVFSAGKGATVRDFGAGLFVEEGEASFDGRLQLSYYSNKPDGVLFAGTNAILRFATRAMFANFTTEPITTPIVIRKGTFIVEDDPSNNAFQQIGPLTLDNGIFDYSGLNGYGIYQGVLSFSGKLTFRGDAPYEILQTGMSSLGGADAKKMHLWGTPRTEFDVAELSGDGGEDLIMGVKLVDQSLDTKSPGVAPGGIVKTGAGTLSLTNALNSFNGDIEVREGILQVGPNWQLNSSRMTNSVDSHWIGALTNENRRIVVKSGAALFLPNRNCFGAQLGITNRMEGINLSFVFDGGAFTNPADQGFLLPDVTFSNGGSISPGGYGNSGYGRFMVKERFRVTGSIPFEWMPSADALANDGRMSREALSLNGVPENVFEIEDVTGDPSADATFGVPFIIGYSYFRDIAAGNHLLDDWAFGFTKVGAGTMCITAKAFQQTSSETRSGLVCRSFNGDVKVNEGALQVDGDISLSDTVRVASGAFLSGTGTVNNVAIAAGGGLRVPLHQTHPLRICGGLSVVGGLVVDVVAPEMTDVKDIKASILDVEGEVSGIVHFDNAVITMNGEPVQNVRLQFADGKLKVLYMRGIVVSIR